MVKGFLQWVQQERQLKGSTMSTYIHHLITGLRYGSPCTEDPENMPHVHPKGHHHQVHEAIL